MQDLNAKANERSVYIRLRLDIEELDEVSRARLEQAGVDCVQDGGAYCAYGVIDDTDEMVELAAAQPHVEAVDFAAPPVGF